MLARLRAGEQQRFERLDDYFLEMDKRALGVRAPIKPKLAVKRKAATTG